MLNIKRHKNKFDYEKEKEIIYSYEKDEKNKKGVKNITKYSDRNYNNTQNKFINLNDGDIKLFQKFRNKQATIENSNLNAKRKVNLKNNKNQTKNIFNKTNKTLNYIISKNSKKYEPNINQNMKENKPFKLNNYQSKQNDIVSLPTNFSKNENDIELNNAYEHIQRKIIFLKDKLNFKGSNEKFIKYLTIVKLKSDITYLVEILFNNGENLNEENAKKCFDKLGNLLDYKTNEQKLF